MILLKTYSKSVVWLHGEIKTPPFSFDSRIEAGALIRQLQKGHKISLPHSRPLPSVGRGCHELRISDESHFWRIVYYIDSEVVVILEVFAKTSNQTPLGVIDACKARLKLYKATERG